MRGAKLLKNSSGLALPQNESGATLKRVLKVSALFMLAVEVPFKFLGT